MKRILNLFVPMLACATVSAQTLESISATGDSQVPVTTVVPVQQTPVRIAESSTVMEPAAGKMTRAQRRAYKADKFAYRVDSLVRSRNFVFYPTTVQAVPDGESQNIFAQYYYFGFFTDSVEVHLPSVNGVTQFVSMMNFDSAVMDYKLLPFQSGLTSTFAIDDSGQTVFCRFVVSTVTGETVLTMTTPAGTMRYVGWLSRERRKDNEKADQL